LGLGLSLDPEAVCLAGAADWADWAVPSAHFTPFLAGGRSEELRRGEGLSVGAAERGIAALLLLRAGGGLGDGARAGGFAAGFTVGFAGGLERLRGGIAMVESGIWG
jgi:hypothetical protein